MEGWREEEGMEGWTMEGGRREDGGMNAQERKIKRQVKQR